MTSLAALRACLVWGALLAWRAEAFSEQRPLVIFFGGSGTTEVDMRRWAAAAGSEPRYGGTFAFEAVPHAEDEAVNAKAAAVLVDRFGSDSQRPTVLVGHSSGAATAAATYLGLERRRGRGFGPGTTKLIILDDGLGIDWRPPQGFRLDKRIECWSAVSGTVLSLRHTETIKSCPTYYILRASRCSTPICLHFWLVNRNVPLRRGLEELQRTTEGGESLAYRDLDVNLDWLRETRAPRGWPE